MQNKQQTESYVGRGFFLRFWHPGMAGEEDPNVQWGAPTS